MCHVEDAAESVSKARRFDLRTNGRQVFSEPQSALERYFATNTRNISLGHDSKYVRRKSALREILFLPVCEFSLSAFGGFKRPPLAISEPHE